jgi:hypothetical protein
MRASLFGTVRLRFQSPLVSGQNPLKDLVGENVFVGISFGKGLHEPELPVDFSLSGTLFRLRAGLALFCELERFLLVHALLQIGLSSLRHHVPDDHQHSPAKDEHYRSHPLSSASVRHEGIVESHRRFYVPDESS